MVLQLSSHSQQHQAVNHLSLLEGATHHSREREQFGVIKVITGSLKKSIGTYQLASWIRRSQSYLLDAKYLSGHMLKGLGQRRIN